MKEEIMMTKFVDLNLYQAIPNQDLGTKTGDKHTQLVTTSKVARRLLPSVPSQLGPASLHARVRCFISMTIE